MLEQFLNGDIVEKEINFGATNNLLNIGSRGSITESSFYKNEKGKGKDLRAKVFVRIQMFEDEISSIKDTLEFLEEKSYTIDT